MKPAPGISSLAIRAVMNESTTAVSSVGLMDGGGGVRRSHAGSQAMSVATAIAVATEALVGDEDIPPLIWLV